ncbi:MAG: hypothetical protein WAL56_08735 [Candidatus Sulfotelmatobacter sp.]
MRYSWLMLASILLAVTAYAKEPKAYVDGKLSQMDSVQCGTDESAKKAKTQEILCQEYLVETDQVAYRISPAQAPGKLLAGRHPVSSLCSG